MAGPVWIADVAKAGLTGRAGAVPGGSGWRAGGLIVMGRWLWLATVSPGTPLSCPLFTNLEGNATSR